MSGERVRRLGMEVMIVGVLATYALLFIYATGGAVLTGTGLMTEEAFRDRLLPWLLTLIGVGGASFPVGLLLTRLGDRLGRREREQADA